MYYLVYFRPDEDREIEMSVYDVKDHPDYQFRPGNTVIRVAGFEVRVGSK